MTVVLGLGVAVLGVNAAIQTVAAYLHPSVFSVVAAAYCGLAFLCGWGAVSLTRDRP